MGRLFKSLGSTPARLQWDIDNNTIKIITLDKQGVQQGIVIDATIDRVDSIYVTPAGEFMLRIDGKLYDMIVRAGKMRAVSQDIVDVLSDGIAGVWTADKNSRTNIDELVAYVNSVQKAKKARYPIKSNVYVYIILAVVLITAAVVVVGRIQN